MAGLIVVFVAFIWAINNYVRPEAQATAYILVNIGLVLGIALKIRTGKVW